MPVFGTTPTLWAWQATAAGNHPEFIGQLMAVSEQAGRVGAPIEEATGKPLPSGGRSVMQRIRPFLAATATLVAASGIVLLPVVTSATPASATATCGGTSLATSLLGYSIRIPTVGNATPKQWSCILGPGDDSTAVSRLQIDLNDCFGDDLAVDGDYGPLTQAAVEGAQRKEGVTADGIYGPQTVMGGSGGFFEYQVSGYGTGFCDGLAEAF